MASLDIDAVQAQLRAFAAERDWERFHTPKNLAMALSVEAAELVELFQWLTPEESVASSSGNAVFNEAVADEIADILIYALRLADVTGIDVAAAIASKIAKNAIKHPSVR